MTDEPSTPERPKTRPVFLWLGGVLLVLFVGGCIVGLASNSNSSSRPGEVEFDASARVACRHFTELLVGASDRVLTPLEYRAKAQEVYDAGRYSDVAAVRDGAVAMLSSITAGDGAGAGFDQLLNACPTE